MLKNDICITVIGQAVLEFFHFKVDIPRKNPIIRMSIEYQNLHVLISVVKHLLLPWHPLY